MGFAKAAELNHYPGPKHVLQLAKELHLSKEQVEQTRTVFDEMQTEAISIGRLVVEIGRLKGELRAVHLRAHLEMRKILMAHQIDRYDEIRGYAGDEGEGLHRRHGDY